MAESEFYTQLWFWLIVIGIILVIIGIIVWSIQRKVEWYHWALWIGGGVLIIIGVFLAIFWENETPVEQMARNVYPSYCNPSVKPIPLNNIQSCPPRVDVSNNIPVCPYNNVNVPVAPVVTTTSRTTSVTASPTVAATSDTVKRVSNNVPVRINGRQ